MTRLDRDAASDVLDAYYGFTQVDVLDVLEGCVRPVPAQTIDREALIVAVKQGLRDPAGRGESGDLYGAIADQVLALLRPVDGVTLTRDDVSVLSEFLDDVILRAQKVSPWALWAYDLKRRLQAAS